MLNYIHELFNGSAGYRFLNMAAASASASELEPAVVAAGSKKPGWYFVLCRGCYWCASCVKSRFMRLCPACASPDLSRSERDVHHSSS